MKARLQYLISCEIEDNEANIIETHNDNKRVLEEDGEWEIESEEIIWADDINWIEGETT